mmetsp:Transcript_5620/g.14404  ORF Transcript_5620/g.14404 Transcript_5620/m.14404 type:complete len:187 (+) Transcript_5620:266-826(+)
MGDDGEGLSLGKKLLISCKIGDFDNVMKLLDDIDELEDDQRDAALEVTDKKGNTHLHLIVQTDEAMDEFYETPLDDKKVCVYRLLDLALNPDDTNDAMETVFDVCPREFERTLGEHSDKKRRSGVRGGSLVAEGATLSTLRAAGTALKAVAKFKKGHRKAAEAAAAGQDASPSSASQALPGGVRMV